MMTLTNTTAAELQWIDVDCKAPFGVLVIPDPPAELVLVPVAGLATGVAGLYWTPLASAATWNTEPPPNS